MRRYLMLFVAPYAVLVLVLIIGFAWTARQEQTLRDEANALARIDELTRTFVREQCQLDGDKSAARPQTCSDLETLPQPGETEHF